MAKTKNEGGLAEPPRRLVRTLLRWAGDDPEREGLLETPKRVGQCLSRLVLGI